MTTTHMIVLPGDTIPASSLPISTNPNKALTLGPGLRHIPPNTIKATISGALTTDVRKNATWIEYNSGRYQPSPSDLVIAIIASSVSESYTCTLTPYAPPTTLPHLSFESATKKTRPVLPLQSLVYARILPFSRYTTPELTCIDPSTGKADGLGPLKGGMVFDISLAMARRLLAGAKGGVMVLEMLAEKLVFEVAVGRNGVIWVEGGNVTVTLKVGMAVQEVDRGGLGVEGQRALVEKVLRGL
ncbi:hypothetical protein K432DRAFT_356982 [Lepidopterella palustris CBS 459.81]|uniref:Ribosomal RNA-processing protein 40 n=1 Tax=Lepidopterella palustris CBS 459.81 TaxID=1314670 RepID=A0A8E2E6Z7_9PEZI|nr:hypothetical protein K432DRAFT_356982 [Lepidopterella palustris CBS 459.81]